MNTMQFHILVVDDDAEYARTCARALVRAGYTADAFSSADDALDAVARRGDVALVLTDLMMPVTDGIMFLQEVKRLNPAVDVIIMTGYGTIESAVRAVKAGASEYITKPFDQDELMNAVGKVYRVWQLQDDVKRLRKLVAEKLQLQGFVFKHPEMTRVYDRIASAAGCNCSVFITGESGTGKELVARAIHGNSRRSDGPFVPINCSALTGSLIESELFGFRKGAFTGAARDYDGLFIAANGGTLFLDEVAEMEPGTQAKLLRSIQDRTVRPIGSVEERPIDVRFIAATNRSVKGALADKQLREDLYHRLNVIQIDIPPLRSMRDDIPDLMAYLLNQKGAEHGKGDCSFDGSAMNLLKAYSWPGNVREAVNVVEQALLNAQASVISANDLPPRVSAERPVRVEHGGIPTFDEAERDLILRALRQANGNKSRAAELLGISRPRLYKKIEQYDIDEVSP
ncbi:MAG TPA: sigma-54 dependent transcriptional regulator [Candidatus Deferrimicrobium sp.]|nr:sigma-54 dependent transcriptional regulator [Candidatus Deferrimicrobium sp.]